MYPCLIKNQDGAFNLSLIDFPNIKIRAKTQRGALIAAKKEVLSCMKILFKNKKQIPLPSKPKRTQSTIELDINQFAKVLLLNEITSNRTKLIDLGAAIKMSPASITRLISLAHTTKIETINEALHYYSKKIVVHIEPV